MADLQKQFGKFHKEIKVESEELREKRNILFEKIKKSLSENNKPIPEILNQGSYIYGVGIKPVFDEEYDIDVGLDFNIKSSDYKYKPEEVRKWVFDAVKNHTKKDVEKKGPCIRVKYQKGFHVDLVCYARHKTDETIEFYQLAHKDGSWEPSDPKKIKDHIKTEREKFKSTKDSSGSDQLQRVVRYLKRWNDLVIPGESDDKPIGLAILLYCIDILQNLFLDHQGNPDDLQALIYLSEKAKNSNRISAYKPDTQEDVFGKISDEGMRMLIQRFEKLHDALLEARNSDDLKNACEIMRKQFGNDFPLEENNVDVTDKKSALLSAISTYKTSFKPYARTE